MVARLHAFLAAGGDEGQLAERLAGAGVHPASATLGCAIVRGRRTGRSCPWPSTGFSRKGIRLDGHVPRRPSAGSVVSSGSERRERPSTGLGGESIQLGWSAVRVRARFLVRRVSSAGRRSQA